MGPPFIVLELEKNIKQSTGWLKRNSSKQNGVRESNTNTGDIKKMNLIESIFAKFKSAMKSYSSKQNGLPESSRSKSPKSRTKSIVNETPLSAASIKTANLKVSSYSELKSAMKKSRSKHNGLTESNRSKNIVNETPPSSTGNIKTLNLRSSMKSNCSNQNGLTDSSRSRRSKQNGLTESRSRRSKSILNETPTGSGNIKTPKLKVFTYAELKSATMNFKPSTLLGEGGFGQVFMGWVNKKTYTPSKANVGMAVAIKKSNPDSHQGLKQWQSEIKFLGNLSHPNIIKLLGYCREGEEFLLVYEYAEKGSLENHLFRKNAEPLPWGIRLKIAIGAARGLAFLHTSEKPIFHRDFKTSNILLDRDYNAKLSDFGLATYGELNENTHVPTHIKDTLGVTNGDIHVTTHIKCSNGDTQVTTQIKSMFGLTSDDTQVTTQISWTNGHTHVTTRIRGALNLKNNRSHMTMGVTGTYGYAAPEYIATGHLNIKSDVYSFGVVVLELLTGLPAIDNSRPSGRHSLVDWAKPLLSNTTKLMTIMDPLLQEQYPSFGAYQTAQLALKCLESDPQNRPSMVQVLENLEQIDAAKGRKQSSPKPARRTTVYESLKSLHSSRVCTSTLSSAAMVGTSVRAQAH